MSSTRNKHFQSLNQTYKRKYFAHEKSTTNFNIFWWKRRTNSGQTSLDWFLKEVDTIKNCDKVYIYIIEEWKATQPNNLAANRTKIPTFTHCIYKLILDHKWREYILNIQYIINRKVEYLWQILYLFWKDLHIFLD